jgi:hypothetical protein
MRVLLVGQRYSSDGFLCLGDFFHHGLRDCTSGFIACWLCGFSVFVKFCVRKVLDVY